MYLPPGGKKEKNGKSLHSSPQWGKWRSFNLPRRAEQANVYMYLPAAEGQKKGQSLGDRSPGQRQSENVSIVYGGLRLERFHSVPLSSVSSRLSSLLSLAFNLPPTRRVEQTNVSISVPLSPVVFNPFFHHYPPRAEQAVYMYLPAAEEQKREYLHSSSPWGGGEDRKTGNFSLSLPSHQRRKCLSFSPPRQEDYLSSPPTGEEMSVFLSRPTRGRKTGNIRVLVPLVGWLGLGCVCGESSAFFALFYFGTGVVGSAVKADHPTQSQLSCAESLCVWWAEKR